MYFMGQAIILKRMEFLPPNWQLFIRKCPQSDIILELHQQSWLELSAWIQILLDNRVGGFD